MADKKKQYPQGIWNPAEHPDQVPAFSTRQPFASLLAQGVKQIELRGWSPKYRGWILIHAAKHWYGQTGQAHADYEMSWASIATHTIPYIQSLNTPFEPTLERVAYPLGAIVGVAKLERASRFTLESWERLRYMHCSNGRFDEHYKHTGLSCDVGWLFSEALELARPIPVAGASDFFGVAAKLLPANILELFDAQKALAS